MTEGATEADNDDGGSGCLYIIGSVIVGIATGNIWSAELGWLVLGLLLIFGALISGKTT